MPIANLKNTEKLLINYAFSFPQLDFVYLLSFNRLITFFLRLMSRKSLPKKGQKN